MAGIGFELKKLYSEKGIIMGLRAFLYSFVVTIGPMILCIVLINGMQEILENLGVGNLQRQELVAVIEYAFVFSLLIAGGFAMYLSRFISDMISNESYSEIRHGLEVILTLTLIIGSLLAIPFLAFSNLDFVTALMAYVFFMLLIIVWIYAIAISALKDYKKIFLIYLIGWVIGIGVSLLMALKGIANSDYYLFAILSMFLFIGAGMRSYVRKVFKSEGNRSYESVRHLGLYGNLVGVGFFLNAGIYIHNMIYWLSSEGSVIKGNFFIAPFYDMPMFYAFMTIIPSMVLFVVMFETNFYDKYRAYYNQVVHGGGYKEQENAKKDMIQALFHEFSGVMELQLFFTIIFLLLGRIFLPMTGLSFRSIDIFSILTFGCFIYAAVYIVIMILLYFDDVKGAYYTTAVFFVSNGIFTGVSLFLRDWAHGVGFFASVVLTFFVGFYRLNYYVNNLDYFTYCNQPLLAVEPKAWAVKIANRLESLSNKNGR